MIDDIFVLPLVDGEYGEHVNCNFGVLDIEAKNMYGCCCEL